MTAPKCQPVIEAFILAVVVPALLWAPWGFAWFLIVLVIAAVHALCLGVPLVWLLRPRGWLNMATAVVGGFMIGATPCAIKMWRATTMGGMATGIQWPDYLKTLLFYGAFGALSGFVFRGYLWAREKTPQEHPT